jgi:hypothetical protein
MVTKEAAMTDNTYFRFWFYSLLACASAALPFIPGSNFAFWLIRIFAAPVLWIAGFWGASCANKRIGIRQWWLWLAAPFAFRYVAELVAMVVFGIVTGDKL